MKISNTKILVFVIVMLILPTISLAGLTGDFGTPVYPSSFLELNDTPSTYSGSDNFFVQVYSSALRFFDLFTWITDYTYNKTDVYNKTEIDEFDFLTDYDETDPIWAGDKGNYYNSSITDALLDARVPRETEDRTIYCNESLTTGNNDGTSWANAFQGKQGIRDAIDSVKPTIDSCVITINMTGNWDDWTEEESGFSISKVTLNDGYIQFVADDYVENAVITSATANTVEFSGTYPADYWNDTYVTIIQWGHGLGVRSGEVRKIIDSSSTGGITTLTVNANWDLTPVNPELLHIAGKAKFKYAPFGFGLFNVNGKLNNVFFKGFAFYGFNSAEESIIHVNDGISTFMDCIFYNNTGSYSIWAKPGTNVAIHDTGVKYGADADASITCTGCAYLTVSGCVFDEVGAAAIKVEKGGTAWLQYNRFRGVGTTDILVTKNAVVDILGTEGQDGGLYGIRATTGAQVTVTGVGALSESADAATFAYIS